MLLKKLKRTRLSTRRPTRKSMNKLALRKNLKLSTGSSRKPPTHFHIVHDVFKVNASTTSSAVEIPVNPTVSTRWPTYAELYDKYRVISATFEFIPDNNVSSTIAQAGVTYQWQQGQTMIKYDKDDATPCAGLGQAIAENYAIRPSMKRFKYKVVPPKFMQTDDNNNTIFGYHSCQQNVKEDGWLKMFISCNADVNPTYDVFINGYTIIAKYVVIFKDYVPPKSSPNEVKVLENHLTVSTNQLIV